MLVHLDNLTSVMRGDMHMVGGAGRRGRAGLGGAGRGGGPHLVLEGYGVRLDVASLPQVLVQDSQQRIVARRHVQEVQVHHLQLVLHPTRPPSVARAWS